MSKYDKILNRPHHRSEIRIPMPLADRAAQFAPFSALSGHAEGTAEVARVTQPRRELTEERLAELNQKIQQILSLEGHPKISITYFVPDSKKSGGEYITTQGKLKKIDPHRGMLVLTDWREIPLGDVVALEETCS